MGDFVNVYIGAPDGQTAVSLSSADKINVSIAAGFTGSGGGGGGATNITITRAATTVTVNSDTGTDGTIAAADGTNAGVMTAAMQTKLAGIETGAEVNDSAAEILAKVITVDGAGSGLDADLLDGNHANAFAAAVHTHVIADVSGLQTALDGKAATVHTHAIGDVTGLQTALDSKVDENAAITGATKTKITYDAKGLVTAGADATTADIADSSNKRYVTDANLTVINNTSGTNTGDQTITLTGDVTGTGTGSFAATIANNAVTLAKIQDITTARILGRVTAGSGDAEELTGTQATTLLDTFTSSLKGLAPASGGGTSNFLRADGTWAAPSGGGGGGDATSLDANNAQTGPVNTTTETAVYSFTLPTDLAAGEMLELNICGQYRNQTTAKTITSRIKMGGSTILSHAPSVAASASIRPWIGRLLIFIEDPAAVQRMSYFGLGSNNAVGNLSVGIGLTNTPWNGNGYGEATIDLTSAKTLELTCEFNAADANSFVYAESAQLIRYAAP